LAFCEYITYAGIMDIIEHCKELCYLQLEDMESLTVADMTAIYEQCLQTGKEVDHKVKYGEVHHYSITKCRMPKEELRQHVEIHCSKIESCIVV
jgi:hypothetical protein